MTSLIREWRSIRQDLGPAWVGLQMVTGVAIISRFFQGLISDPILNKTISEILVAVSLGLYVRNWIGLSPRSEAGIKFAIQRILRLGIILLGLRLSLQDVAATGLTALVLVLICISIALTLSYLAGRIFHVPTRLAMLIGVGTAICGNSAIVATAPVIEAKEEEVSFAVATITLFGLMAVLLYPLIGHLLGLSDRTFGLWAGTAVNDTSQVVAVGAVYSEMALNFATIVKLTRNTLMAPLIVLIGLFYNHGLNNRTNVRVANTSGLRFGKLVPGFVFGFLLMSLIRTAGVAISILPQDISQPGNLILAANVLKGLNEVAKFAILMALAGVGLNTNLAGLRRIGFKPLIMGTSVALVLAVISLSLILFSPLGK
jgi:uncharacterized integral membrane protein (TIGR00698 family)